MLLTCLATLSLIFYIFIHPCPPHITSGLPTEELNSFKADPKGTIFAKSNVEINFDVKVAENSANEIHLALPYYERLDNITSEMVADSELDDVAGGEVVSVILVIIGTICAVGAGVVGAAAGATAVVGGVTTGIVAGVYDSQGKNIKGEKK